MKILLVADLHYALKQYDWIVAVAREFDAICIAGDLLEIASPVPVDAQVVVVRTLLARLAARSRVLVCSGNHDLTDEDAGGERVAPWIADLGEIDVVADGECLPLGDTLLSVFPWWDGPATRGLIAAQLARDAARRAGEWIWVYHAPPAGSATAWGGRRHYGDEDLTRWIAEYRPTAVLSGHVHLAPFVADGSWADRIGETWVFNMGQQLGPVPAHIVLNTRTREALWFSLEGRQHLLMGGGAAAPVPLADLPDWLTAGGPLPVPGP